jgi:hypothetical protein
MTLWPLGEVQQARVLAEEMVARASHSGHLPTLIYGHGQNAIIEMIGRNPARAAPHIEKFARLARDNGMQMWIAFGSFPESWARWHLWNAGASM